MDFINFDFLLRIVVALILGFSLGLERELTNKYAGLRTHILVCIGACVFTIVSVYGFPTFADGDNVVISQATGIRDTSRVAAQIVTGIGFIGAGTVLRNGPIIIGLTTAATLWISASIGMACGVGMYEIAIIATIFSVVVLTLIRIFEKRFLPAGIKKNKRYKISLTCQRDKDKEFQQFLYEKVEKVDDFSVKVTREGVEMLKITSAFELGNKVSIQELYSAISELFSVESVTIQELND